MSRKRELASPVHEGDHAIGPASAAVTVVEYGDFECPYCAQAAPGIHLMLKRYGGDVRFVFRHFPLDVHPHAIIAAEASEAAGTQGRFWEMHDLLFRKQARLERGELDRYARDVGLDLARYALEMDGHVHLTRIEADRRTGRQGGVRRTPGLYVNGLMLDVEFELQHLYDAVDAALQR